MDELIFASHLLCAYYQHVISHMYYIMEPSEICAGFAPSL